MWENSDFQGFYVGRWFQNLARWAHSQAQNGRGTARRVPDAQFGNGDCRENKFKKLCGKSNFHNFSLWALLSHFQLFFVTFKYKILQNLNFPQIVVNHFCVPDKALKVSRGFPRQFLIEEWSSRGHSGESVEKWNWPTSPSTSKTKIWCTKMRYFMWVAGSKI